MIIRVTRKPYNYPRTEKSSSEKLGSVNKKKEETGKQQDNPHCVRNPRRNEPSYPFRFWNFFSVTLDLQTSKWRNH